MNKINTYIEKNISKIITIFLLSSPFIDLLTSLSVKYISSSLTIGMFLRTFFLFFLYYYALFINKENRKRTLIISLIITFLLLINISLSLITNASIIYETKVFFKTFYILLTINALINIKAKIDLKYLFYTFTIYLILIFIPNILNIGFDTYEETKVGSVGWFYAANEIGAIISILLPITLYYIFKQKNKLFMIFYLIFMIYTITSIGTKAPIISLGITAFFFLILYIYKLFKEKQKTKLILLTSISVILLTIAIIVVPKTNFYKNLVIHLNYLKINNVTDFIKDPTLIDKFMFGSRFKLFSNNLDLIEEKGYENLLLGIGANHRQAELDLLDIFINYGIIGIIVFITLLIYLIKKSKPKLNKYTSLSLFLGLLISILSGHVLVSPAVNIYLSLILTNKITKKQEKLPLNNRLF